MFLNTMISGEDLLFVLVVSFSIYGFRSHKLSCPKETSLVEMNGNLFTVTWTTNTESYMSLVISNPPCLDKNDNLVYRICLNGTWVRKSMCSYIDTKTNCPPDFVEDDEHCVYVTPPQTFEETCPHPGASTKIDNYDDIWIPIRQITPYTAYEYVLPDERYGLQYSNSESSESSEEILETSSDCIVKKKKKLDTVSCDAKFSRVCSYKHNSFLFKCPKGCVGGGLGSDYCFCKQYTRSCETLAIPSYAYERNIINKLIGNDTCLLGFTPFRNFYIVGSNDELLLTNTKEFNCAVCVEKPLPFDNVIMSLKFSAKNRKLLLTIYSPEGLFQIDDDVQVFCFTDATDQLKKRVKIEFEFDSKSTNWNGTRYQIFKVSISEDGPGYYWCESFLLPNVTVIQSNKVLAFKEFKYSEYSLRLQIQNLCKFSLINCKIPSEEFLSSVSKTLFDYSAFEKFVKNVRLFRIYDVNVTTATADILVHISVKTKFSLEDEYRMVEANLKNFDQQIVSVLFFHSCSFCLSNETIFQNESLNWPTSSVGTSTAPKEICVNESGIPITRKCEGNFHTGSVWESVTHSCASNYSVSPKTTFLYSLVSGNVSIQSTQNLSRVTTNSSDLTILDVHYITKILRQYSNLSQNHSQGELVDLGEAFSNLMCGNESVLWNSQMLLNATDELLNVFDDSLQSTTLDNDTILLVFNNLVIHITKPWVNNISGIALYGNNQSGFLNYSTKELFSNTTTDAFENDPNFDLAVYIPEVLLNSLISNLSTTDVSNITITTSIYFKDTFFNTNSKRNDTLVSKVVSVSISGYGDYLPEPVPVIFKSKGKHSNKTCAFWDYGLQSENHTGSWSSLGSEISRLNSTELCLFSHLTNFALLIKTDQIVDMNDTIDLSNLVTEKYHDNILDIISNVGCTFSVIGIFGIFLTAVLFKCWREKVGTRILMQLCIALFLQIIFLNLATVSISRTVNAVFCTSIGVILHYVTVAEFSWMLVAAILQFYRFVKVIGPMPNRIILKSMLVGWGLPLIPIVLICSISIDSYSRVLEGICYPTGLALYLGVFLPIILIILGNLVVFVIVICNIFRLNTESQGGLQKNYKRQIYLSVLLFFLLGLPWIFGLVAEVLNALSISYIFLYLFCFTATLQGFVLFLFYVVLDNSTRSLWANLLKNKFSQPSSE